MKYDGLLLVRDHHSGAGVEQIKCFDFEEWWLRKVGFKLMSLQLLVNIQQFQVNSFKKDTIKYEDLLLFLYLF